MEGCICAEGFVLDNAEETCIPAEECGCSTDDNYYAVSYGERVYIQGKQVVFFSPVFSKGFYREDFFPKERILVFKSTLLGKTLFDSVLIYSLD